MEWCYYLAAGLFGLAFGSFFNVCIYRIPRGMSLGDRSVCPGCGATIRWYDNIPLASIIALRGKCRDCGMRISLRYPLVEVTTALLFVLIYWWSVNMVPDELKIAGGGSFEPELLIGLVLVSVMIVSVGADLSHGIVPNKAVIAGTVLMAGLVPAIALYRGEPGRIPISLGSGAIGGGFLLVAGLTYGFLFMRREPGGSDEREEVSAGEDHGESADNQPDENDTAEQAESVDGDIDDLPTGVGFGDVKLMFFAGLALGYFHWYLILVALFLGYLCGAVVSVFLMAFAGLKRKDPLPFVPFLAAGSIVALIWGQWLVDTYLKLLR